MPDAIFVKRNKLGSLKEYIFEVTNITQTATQEQVFTLDNSYGTFDGIKVASYNMGNTVTVSSFIYEKTGVVTPTVYGIYESSGSFGGAIDSRGLGRPFINNDTIEVSKIYGKFRNTSNTATGTITVAFYIKE